MISSIQTIFLPIEFQGYTNDNQNIKRFLGQRLMIHSASILITTSFNQEKIKRERKRQNAGTGI